MMQRYRFVGCYTEIGDRVFSRIGQSADWDEEHYRSMVTGLTPFLPESDFSKVQFTQDELDRYADYANRPLAPESFNAKVKRCAVMLHDLREKLKTRQVQEEVASAPIAEPTAVGREI